MISVWILTTYRDKLVEDYAYLQDTTKVVLKMWLSKYTSEIISIGSYLSMDV